MKRTNTNDDDIISIVAVVVVFITKMIEVVLRLAGLFFFFTLLVLKWSHLIRSSHHLILSVSASICSFLSSSLCICIILSLIIIRFVITSSTEIKQSDDENGSSPFILTLLNSDFTPTTDSTATALIELDGEEPAPDHDQDMIFDRDKEEEEEEGDSMDATWKAIAGKPKIESDTIREEVGGRSWGVRRLDSEEVLPSSPLWRELRKAETFNDAMAIRRRGGLIRRDPSISLEEFNMRVEAFIQKFNVEMRIQRQESRDRRCLAIINIPESFD